MPRRSMSRMQAVKLIKGSGRIFAVTFVKRTNGALRHMVARGKVTAWLKGGGLSFDPNAKRLIIVADMQKSAYRCIPIEGLRALIWEGKHYVVK